MTIDRDYIPPCTASPQMFESVDLADAFEAQYICNTQCEAKFQCALLLRDVKKEYGYSLDHGPRGTWAGQTLAPQPRERKKSMAAKMREGEPKSAPVARDICGTARGSWRHRSNHERACQPCIDAERVYTAEKRITAAKGVA